MKQLEIRFYSRNELAELLNIELSNKNFARKVKDTLYAWGYDIEYSRKGAEIIGKPETANEKLAELMIRKYNLDIQTDTYDFAIFAFCLMDDIDGFASMPWEARAKYLDENWNVNVASSTLRNWCNKLLNKNSVIKDKDKKTYWQSFNVNGVKYQEELKDGKDNPQWKKYWKRFFELKEAGCEDIGKTLYMELGYCVYSCAGFAFSAFDDTDLLEDMLNLIAEIANEEAVDIVVRSTTEIIKMPRVSEDCLKASNKADFEAFWRS